MTNRFYRNRAVRKLMDRSLAIDRRRSLPELAPFTFQSWFTAHRGPQRPPSRKVILWDDCHISFHQPQLGIDAVRVLEAAGFEVMCLSNRKCCGRPMLSKGLLKQARANARHNVALLYPYAQAGFSIVGIEPSCIACFREEYPDLLKTDQARTVAAQSFFFEEFICRLAEQKRLSLTLPPPPRPRDILVHTHCYQKAFGTAEKVIAMLRLLPDTQVTEVQSGCCGMAGTFGYEKEHYDISMAIGEMALFPAVRAAGRDTLIAAAGTSCREQIKDGTRRAARHPISILADALGPFQP
jgi:Fe-S oxidoreductase